VHQTVGPSIVAETTAERTESANFRSRGVLIGGGVFLITIAAFFRVPLVPEIGRDFALSAFGIGALSSAFALGRVLTDMPAGRATDRVSVGPMLAIAALLVSVGSGVMAAAWNTPLVFVGSFLLGIGSSWTLTTAFAYFATAPRRRRGIAMSMFAAAMLVGQAIGPTVGGWLGELTGWRPTLFIAAGGIGVVGFGFLGIRSLRVVPSAVERRAGASTDLATPIVLRVIYSLPAIQFSIGAAINMTLVPLVADEDLGLGVAVIGLALGAGGIARLVGALIAGQLSDRVSRRAALIPGLILQVAGLAVFAYLGGRFGWWLAILLLALGSIPVNVGSTMLADLSEQGGLGERLGRFRFTGDATFLVAPLITGYLYEHGGRTIATLPLLAATVVVAVAAVIVLPETRSA
jgi:MFS family permease